LFEDYVSDFSGAKELTVKVLIKTSPFSCVQFVHGVTLKFAYHQSGSFSEKSGGCYFLEAAELKLL